MDFLASLITPSNLTNIGAGYAALQALAFFLARILPAHTVAAKAAREVTKWPAQLVPKPVEDPANPKP